MSLDLPPELDPLLALLTTSGPDQVVRIELGQSLNLAGERVSVVETARFYERVVGPRRTTWKRVDPLLVAPNDGKSRAALLRLLADWIDGHG